MFPTDPPPPLMENSNAVSDTKASLDGMVHRLHELIFKIAIPKLKAAKMTSIAIDALLLTCELAESAHAQLQGHHGAPLADDISRQLEDIRAHLGISSAARMSRKPSYAAALTADIKSSVPAAGLPPPQPQPRPCVTGRFSIMLVQKSHDKPVFADLSNNELIGKILDALRTV